VKGPGDRLQDNQIRWLAYCAQHGMPVRVLDVRWADDDAAVAGTTTVWEAATAVTTAARNAVPKAAAENVTTGAANECAI